MQTGAIKECFLKSSLVCILEICISTAGISTAKKASLIATLVCVYAAGLITIPSKFSFASCIYF